MDFQPQAQVTVGGMPGLFGYRQTSPWALWTVAEKWNAESGGSQEGRYREDKRRFEAPMGRKRVDTSLASGRNTGIIFTADAGTWRDNWKNPIYNTYGLLVADCAPGTLYQATTTSNLSTALEAVELTLFRGNPGVSATSSDYHKDNCYTQLVWGIGLDYQYRLNFLYGEPLSLQFSKDGGATWFAKVQNRLTPNLETMLAAFNNILRLNVMADHSGRYMRVEFGNGYLLSHGLPTDLANTFSSPAKFRILHENGYLGFSYFPLRYQPLTVTTGEFSNGAGYPNLGAAQVIANALDGQPVEQTNSPTLVPTENGFRVEITGETPDAGDGEGSAQSPVFTDITVVAPATYTNEVNGIPDARTVQLQPTFISERQTFNAITRLFRSSAEITCLNEDGSLNDMNGALACFLDLGNGSGLRRRITGVAENPAHTRSDPSRLFHLHLMDKLVYLEEPIHQKVCMDNWCIWSIAHFVAQVCGIGPQWLTGIPLYIPPGAPLNAPWGPAGVDCPYPTVGRGTGANPKFLYTEETTGIQILNEVFGDQSVIDPGTGQPAPYIIGTSPYGDLIITPYLLSTLSPKIVYSDIDPSGYGLISEQIQWEVDTSSMRTGIYLQGVDAQTKELINLYEPMSAQVRATIGRPRELVDRNARHFSIEAMKETMRTMRIPASLPSITGTFTAPFHAHVFAGDMVGVYDSHKPQFSGWYIVEDSLMQQGYLGATDTAVQVELRVRSILSYL